MVKISAFRSNGGFLRAATASHLGLAGGTHQFGRCELIAFGKEGDPTRPVKQNAIAQPPPAYMVAARLHEEATALAGSITNSRRHF
jgi:hypothetical protein